jgi:hypothetical protein
MTEFNPDFQVDNGALALFSQYLGINDVDQIRRHILETTERLKTVSSYFPRPFGLFAASKLVPFFLVNTVND